MSGRRKIGVTEVEQHKKEYKEWGRRAAQVIRKKAGDQGISPTTWLRGFGVPEATARDMFGGTISEKYAWVYALLFVQEGIGEVDPRTIPPRVASARGRFFLVARAWSDADLEKWKRQHANVSSAEKAASSPLIPSQDPAQNVLNVILAQISQHTADEVMRRLESVLAQLFESQQQRVRRTPGQIVSETLRLLERAIEGGPIDRDELISTVTMEKFRLLFKYAGDFTLPRDERETAVRTNYATKERSLP